MNRLPLIEKIHLLESRLGEWWANRIFEPVRFDSSDTIKVHEVAQAIGTHLGLPPLNLHISYVPQNESVSGNIRLDQSTEVFIEISPEFKNNCVFVSAILAHELCHKFLQINNLTLFPEYENEMLTDAATIYTGLGKLSLNGCENTRSEIYNQGGSFTALNSTQKIGYMNLQQFAFVYRLVCEMRRMPQNMMLQGLNYISSNEVKNISIETNYFNADFFYNDSALKEISEVVKNEIGDSQKYFANFDRNIKVIQKNILLSANLLYKEFHFYTKSRTDKLSLSANRTFNKESHNYIKNLVVVEELKFLKTKIAEKKNEIIIFKDVMPRFINQSNYFYPKWNLNLDFLLQFECPNCSSRMRINENKLVRVKCPMCHYSFIIDAGPDEVLDSIPEVRNIVKRMNLWMKIKGAFFSWLLIVK